MIEKGYTFPYLIHDGQCYGAKWKGNILSMTICRYFEEGHPNEIEVEFHGVEWIRSVFRNDEESWDSFDPDIPLEKYPLVLREAFEADYKEFFAYGLLDDIRALEDNLVFIDDIMFFPCTEIKIIRAVYTEDIKATIDKIF